MEEEEEEEGAVRAELPWEEKEVYLNNKKKENNLIQWLTEKMSSFPEKDSWMLSEEKGKQEMGSDVRSLRAVCEMRSRDCNMSARSVKRCSFLFSLPPFFKMDTLCATFQET